MTVVIRTFLMIGRTFSSFFSKGIGSEILSACSRRGGSTLEEGSRCDGGVFWHYSEQSSPRGHDFAISLAQGWPCNLSVP